MKQHFFLKQPSARHLAPPAAHPVKGWLHALAGKMSDRRFLIQCALLVIYRALLDFMYVQQLSPIYVYSGFTAHITTITYLFSWLMLLLLFPMVVSLQQQKERPSSVLVTFINYIYFIPMTSYIGCKGSTLWFSISVLVYWAVFLLLQLCVPSVRLVKLSNRHTNMLFNVLTAASILLVMGISGVYTGFRLSLDFINVYDIRSEAASYNIPTLFNYLLSWMKIVLPILLLYWLQKKKYWLAGILVVVYLFYYSIGAHKSVFFFLLLLLACFFLYRNWMYSWIAGILSLSLVVCGLIKQLTGSIIPLSLFVRRLIYVPVQLSETYANFFSHNPLNLLRDGILGKLGYEPVYSINIPRLIGETSNANNGLVGDMYANFPAVLGVFLMPLILTISFRLLDIASKDIPPKIFLSFCAYFAISFSNSAWGTVLLSGGFMIVCIMLYLFPSKGENNEHL